MTNVKQSFAMFMASHFGKSEKAVSEKLTTDEHNQFTSEVQELQNTVTGLEGAKATLESEKATLESEKTTLEASVSTLTGEKATLTNSLTTVEADRDKYKAWFEKQAGVGAALPSLDATSKGGPEMTSYNQQALEVYRKSKGL